MHRRSTPETMKPESSKKSISPFETPRLSHRHPQPVTLRSYQTKLASFSVVVALVLFCLFTAPSFFRMGGDPEKTPSPLAKKAKTLRYQDFPSTPIQGAPVPARQLEDLIFVSFNIAGCQPSKAAPKDWTKQNSIDSMHDEIVKYNPDIVTLQECPGDIVWATQVFPGYQAIGNTHSHAGQVNLLIRNGIQAKLVPSFEDLFGNDIPAVIAEIVFGERKLWVASVHLAPYANSHVKRKKQVQAILQAAGSTPLLFTGDTNMRASEDETMESTLGFMDLWKSAGSSESTQWTWDTMDHATHFNKYYGDSTRQQLARYDRAYFGKGSSASLTLSTQSFELIGNQPMQNQYHFLSDHFGILFTVSIDWHDQKSD